jgi:hypothetical protein
VENQIDLGGHSERFRVERNLVLCGHLNRRMHLCGAELREQILCHVCSNHFTFEVHIHVLT